MILLINDDGIDAPGLRALYRELRAVFSQPVLAVAPQHERSGQSHAITLHRGLTVTPRHDHGFFGFAIDGTPVDCTKLALTTLCGEIPELVISGINDGPNVGRSIFYSGTLGAALEAAVEGCVAMAVSRERGGMQFDDAARFAASWAKRIAGKAEFRGQVLNVNVPAAPASAWLAPRSAPHGHSGFQESYKPTRETKDRVGWRLHGEWVAKAGADETDASLLSAGHPVLTMLQPNFNAPEKSLLQLLEGKAGV
ncbi:MAG: 5'/3'-nucleotidase SurE [Planctomycetes bacterium]|nr:5'/3'-nucleotidase SurE [Planctomycetota bacterium]MBA3671991.1 5'/3'-nucleotidase SurE [Gemmatimonadaceae bacterium]